ncbi:ABC transporter substrate-binding protein [Sphaerisporangium sp. NPDC051017]|uniref:ABC transporter substrate-binding protein n=1 Tax=Sphaerisporangium sp. NPDC051017 TaxID=3154636 RepID=UPI00341F5176
MSAPVGVRSRLVPVRAGTAPVVLLLGILLIALAGCGGKPAAGAGSDSSPATITVTDEQKRELTLPADVKRVVSINSYNTELLIALGVRDKIVGIDDRSVFRAPFGHFSKDDVVGVDFGAFNYEKIVAAKPDLVVVPRNGGWEEAATKLESFHIPVLVLTVWDPTIWNDNVRLVSKIFNKQEQADKIINFSDKVHALVKDRVKGLDRVPVYYEDSKDFASAGSKSGKTAAITEGGGRNIFEDVDTNDGLVITVDPADVLVADPDVILRENISQFPPVEQSTLTSTLSAMLQRKGWSSLKAVKSGRVTVYNAGPLDAAGRTFSSLYFGKWLHPDAFADVDPDSYVDQWAKEFLGSSFDGSTGYFAGAGDK